MRTWKAVRYVVDELREHYDDSWWWKKRLIDRFVRPFHAEIYPRYRGSVQMMDEDWDNLFVLDACRADLFTEVADRSRFDEYRTVRSAGSMTMEWLTNNFAGKQFGDTVYVAANPYTSKLVGDAFHQVVEVWRDDFDEDQQTVLAESVADAAREANDQYPDKRLIVHFMQPHYPFVPDSDDFTSWHPDTMLDRREKGYSLTPWEALGRDEVELSDVLRAYRKNLEYVMEHVSPLLEDLPGRTCVTSDHGNLLGERVWPIPIRMYGHPKGVRLSPLIDVPWAVVDGERRTATEAEINPVTADEQEAFDRDDRLRALGYKE